MQNLESLLNYNVKAELARRNFQDFVKYVHEGYEMRWFHSLICDKLTRFEKGEIKKLMVFMPPQHGKSQLTTRLFPAYLLGKRPDCKTVVASYNATLATRFNRDIQRVIDDQNYHEIFPKTLLNESNVVTVSDSYLRNSEIFEIVGYKGFLKAVGRGGALTGTPIDVGIIDDPIKDRQEAMSETIRDGLWSWYEDVFLTRLHNDSQQILIQCMVGKTPVLMSDGSSKFLKNIKIGDLVATYENGNISHSKVLNWKNQGVDHVFKISMKSGILVKANERHPFLVFDNGKLKWKKLKWLKTGDRIVRVMKNGEHIKGLNVPLMDVKNLQNVKDTVCHTTIKPDGLRVLGRHQSMQHQEEKLIYDTDTELPLNNIIRCSKSKTEDAQFAKNCRIQKTQGLIGMVNYALTTATGQGESEDCFATTATFQLDTEKQKKHYSEQRNTYETTLDTIVDIDYDGCENVFDIQIERTENFIANGLVSHNTRWHEDDLAGRILRRENDWEIVVLEAIKESNFEYDLRETGEALWPEKHSLERIIKVKENSPLTFGSLYQQNPKPLDGVGLLWDKKMINRLRVTKKPIFHRIVVAVDPATTSNSNSDETGIMVMGVNNNDIGYLIEDLSGKYTPNEWANVITQAVKNHDADCIVAEKNQGGDMVSTVIRQFDKKTRIKLVHASKGKEVRAEPIYALYEQERIYHIGEFPILENQMVTFNPKKIDKSPDRVDALVWGFTELLDNKREIDFGW